MKTVHPKKGDFLEWEGLCRVDWVNEVFLDFEISWGSSLENWEPPWPVSSMNLLVTSGVKTAPSQPTNEAEVS